MDPVLAWAAAKGLPIIEDCCHAYGSTYKGKLCGAFGVGAFFSGQWNKPFSTGLGGMLQVNDANLLPLLQNLYSTALEPGIWEEWLLSMQIMAYNALVGPRSASAITLLYRALSRLGLVRGSSSNDEFAGTMPGDYFKKMAKCQIREGEKRLRNIEGLIRHRKKITEIYSRELPRMGFTPLSAAPDCDNVILRYPVRVANKDEVLKKALARGVEIGSWFEIPLHPKGINMEQFGYRVGMCPESEKACREVINLPTHGKMTQAGVERVLGFLGKCGQPA